MGCQPSSELVNPSAFEPLREEEFGEISKPEALRLLVPFLLLLSSCASRRLSLVGTRVGWG